MTKYLRAEWIKISTLRSTWICLFLVILFPVGIGLLASGSLPDAYYDTARTATFRTAVFQDRMMIGINFAELVIMVLGVIVISGEYRFGVIRTTFTAAPRRWRVVGAKLLVMSVVSATIGVVATFGTFFLTAARINAVQPSGVDAFHIAIGDPNVLRALFGMVVFFVALGLFGTAIGALFRNQIAAISFVLLYPLIVENIIHLLLEQSDSTKGLGKYLPYFAGNAIQQLDQSGRELSPLSGLAIFVAVTAFLVVLAGALINARDA